MFGVCTHTQVKPVKLTFEVVNAVVRSCLPLARFALPQRALQLHGQLHRKLYFSIVLPHLFGSLGEDDAWLNNMLLLYGKPMRNLTHTSLYLAPVEADTVLSCDGINLYWKMLTS